MNFVCSGHFASLTPLPRLSDALPVIVQSQEISQGANEQLKLQKNNMILQQFGRNLWISVTK